jgi:DNA polymerase III sliding clamp (beta) subunit (PCNA family)
MIETQKAAPDAILFTDDIAAIHILAKVVNRHTTVPALRNILVERPDDGEPMSFFATDLEVSIEYRAPSVGDAFTASLDAEAFVAGVTDIRATGLVAGQRGSYLLNEGADFFVPGGHAESDTPRPTKLTSTLATADTSAIFDILAVSPSASDDLARGEILASVAFEFGESSVRVVATNGYQIATMAFGADVASDAVGRTELVPARVFEHLRRIHEQGNDELRISASAGRLHFSVGRYTLSSKTVAGVYPNYKSGLIFPTPLDWVIVDRVAFATAMQRAARASSARANSSAIVTVADAVLMIATPPKDEASSFRVAAQHEDLSAEPRVALNAHYAADLASRLAGGSIAIGFSGDSLKPVLFRDAVSLQRARAEGLPETMQGALMPLRWGWE